MARIYDMYSVNNTDDSNDSKNDYFVIPNRTGAGLPSKQKDGTMKSFVDFAFRRNYNVLRELGLDKEKAIQRAIDRTMQDGLESLYGRAPAAVNNNNRSGFMRNGTTIRFASPDENDISIYKSYKNNPNWMRAINADSSYDYFYHLQHPKRGEHSYEHTMTNTDDYYKRVQNVKTLKKEIDKYLKSGVTKDWTMNSIRPDLEDMMVLA